MHIQCVFYAFVIPSSGCYIGVYAGLGFCQTIFMLCSSYTIATAGIIASRSLHSKMLANILRAPMSFFDTTPTGRILNRFSKDMCIIDEAVPQSLRTFLYTFFSVISTVTVIVIATPTFGVVIIPLGIFYLLTQVSKFIGCCFNSVFHTLIHAHSVSI